MLMFVDNCSAHWHINNLMFSPPNTTSMLQPMDQGAMKNLKVNYRSRLLNRVLLCVDSQWQERWPSASCAMPGRQRRRKQSSTALTTQISLTPTVRMRVVQQARTPVEIPPTAGADILDDLHASRVDLGAVTRLRSLRTLTVPSCPAQSWTTKRSSVRPSNQRRWTATQMMMRYPYHSHQMWIERRL